MKILLEAGEDSETPYKDNEDNVENVAMKSDPFSNQS